MYRYLSVVFSDFYHANFCFNREKKKVERIRYHTDLISKVYREKNIISFFSFVMIFDADKISKIG